MSSPSRNLKRILSSSSLAKRKLDYTAIEQQAAETAVGNAAVVDATTTNNNNLTDTNNNSTSTTASVVAATTNISTSSARQSGRDLANTLRLESLKLLQPDSSHDRAASSDNLARSDAPTMTALTRSLTLNAMPIDLSSKSRLIVSSDSASLCDVWPSIDVDCEDALAAGLCEFYRPSLPRTSNNNNTASCRRRFAACLFHYEMELRANGDEASANASIDTLPQTNERQQQWIAAIHNATQLLRRCALHSDGSMNWLQVF